MNLKKIVLGTAAALTISLSTGLNAPVEAHDESISRSDVINWVFIYADWYGANPYELLRVAECESELFPYAVGKRGEIGIFQFHPNGIWWSTPQAKHGYSMWDVEANIAAAAWAFSRGYQSHWACY